MLQCLLVFLAMTEYAECEDLNLKAGVEEKGEVGPDVGPTIESTRDGPDSPPPKP